MYNEHGCGINEAVFKLFLNIHHDMLFIEDDKYCQYHWKLQDLLDFNLHYANFGKRSTRTGGFETSYWRKDVVDEAVRTYRLTRKKNVLEREWKKWLKHKYPARICSKRCTKSFPSDLFVDIGVVMLERHGLVYNKWRGKPIYKMEKDNVRIS